MAYQVNQVRVQLPIGSIIQTMATQQDNWILCDGREVDAATFPELKEIMGSTPDLRPRDQNGNLYGSYVAGNMLNGYGTYVPTYIVGKEYGGVQV